MKKLLMALGAVFLIFVLAIGIFVAYFAVQGGALDHESKQYVDEAIPAIVGSWNEGALQSRESPEFRVAVSQADLDKLFVMFRRLGALKSCNGAIGQSNISMTTQQGRQVTASYRATAEFETGPAEILISLVKHDDRWEIFGFQINSRYFLETHERAPA